MELKHARILTILILVILCFSVGILFTIYDRNQQLEASERAKQALLLELKEQKTADSLKGVKVFERNCDGCHPGRSRKHFLLDKTLKKLGEENFVEFVMKEDSLLKAEDPQTIRLNKDYGSVGYTHTFSMSKEEIKRLMEYLK